ncbi:hypothetical protein [Neptuniibacter sp. QD37_11]|uniref:hypothetical protein n=1 Tax=Neptuniibacter sp. QD37_11 TaxID=3398209 RepID=UPI0039F4A5CF
MDYPEAQVTKGFYACPDNIKVGDTVLCKIREYAHGEKEAFDGTVSYVRENFIGVSYLSGYRGRFDDVPYEDVVSKVDSTQPRTHIEVLGSPFNGPMLVFDGPKPPEPPMTFDIDLD